MWGLVDDPSRGNLVAPRSYCPACKAQLRVVNLIPLASYALQRGRCAHCRAGISPRYAVVEAIGGASAIAAVAVFGWSTAAVLAAGFAFALLALAFIDLETGYLPDALTLPLIAAGLAVNGFGTFAPLPDAAIGAAAGYGAFRGLGALYARLRGRDGLGLGDAKLLAGIGAWTGWPQLPLVILVAALATLAAIGAMRLAGKHTARDAQIPFGPGLCAAGFAALLYGERVFSGP